MNRHIITKVNAAPDWSKIPSFEVGCILWEPDAGIRMTQQICYDDAAIYIRQQAVEPHIRAEHNGPLAMVCEDSCMEFFLSPMADCDRYFNFEWNMNGSLYLGYCEDRYNCIRLVPDDAKAQFGFSSQKTADGWEMSYQIPLSFIRLFFPAFNMTSGTEIRANCFKTGDLTVKPHYMSWNPITSTVPDFHRLCDFGIMIFE